jgi:phosphatidylglycerophosphate synthase
MIQLRLLSNLLDGMVAEERGRPSPAGALFNEVPDRISDAVLLIAAGWGAMLPGARVLGFVAALLALLTAYVRTLGGALGVPGVFLGPMAKPQRMALLSLGCVIAAVETVLRMRPVALTVVLLLIIAGSLVTVARRLFHIARALQGR